MEFYGVSQRSAPWKTPEILEKGRKDEPLGAPCSELWQHRAYREDPLAVPATTRVLPAHPKLFTFLP